MSAQLGPPPVGGDQFGATGQLTAMWVLTGISTVFFAARLYSRSVYLRRLGLDDGVIGLSVVLNIVDCIVTQIACHYGVGRHAYYLTLSELSQSLKYLLILQAFGIMASVVPKLGVAILIINIVGTSNRGRWIFYFASIFLIMFGALNCIFLFAQCSPPRAIWEFDLTHTCWKSSVLVNYSIFVGSYSGFLDLAFAIFPVTLFWNLQMKLKRKIVLCVVMGLGVIASICAFIKVSKLKLIAKEDPTWSPLNLFVWAGVEINVIIICACVPTLRPLIDAIFNKPWPTSNRLTGDDIALVAKGSTRSQKSITSQNGPKYSEQLP
ncbi:integral membrane protein [Sclerotinia borealis F-4128]|uniref:Integral membrane protein n=1 Tax=Sclerotinia borealis (strain F-4128) TaxID=1432307 RepID=W9CFD8_SCLBF|nr:integral membrane protein [Sclerotinia borealis F-4128]